MRLTLPLAQTARKRMRTTALLWVATPLLLSAQPNHPLTAAWLPVHSRAAPGWMPAGRAHPELEGCRITAATSLPGSERFASHFLETMASDPSSAGAVWGLTADLSYLIPPEDRALYLSRSSDGGLSWSRVARIDSRYFDAEIGEGLRNGLAVSPGGKDFVITTQDGAFQVIPRSDGAPAVVRPIPGPRVPSPLPELSIPKHPGDPVRAGVVQMTPDGKHMIVGYGYFDMNPQLLTYRRGRNGSWVQDGTLPQLPTDLDIFSMQFARPARARPRWLYVGTGDQAFRLDLRARQWTRIAGVGPDSSIHGMTTVGGLHLAACWGVYNPVDALTVQRVTQAKFLLHRAKDEVGPNIRAYGIEVDPARPNREVLSAITGVYTSKDSGKTWKRLNDLPDGEFHTAHFNADGSVIVSGFIGTFVANPFSGSCAPHLKIRPR